MPTDKTGKVTFGVKQSVSFQMLSFYKQKDHTINTFLWLIGVSWQIAVAPRFKWRILCCVVRWRCVTEIWRYENRYSWPCIDILARVHQWTALNLNRRTPFKIFNKHRCLIWPKWPQRNTTGLPDIKRRNPWNRASLVRITKYLPGVILFFVNLATMCTRALSTVNTRACFLKTLASLQLAISSSIFYSQKSVILLWRPFTMQRSTACSAYS